MKQTYCFAWYKYPVYVYVPAFADFSTAIGEFSSQMKASNYIHKLGVFWANVGEKHPFLTILGVFLYKIYIDGW